MSFRETRVWKLWFIKNHINFVPLALLRLWCTDQDQSLFYWIVWLKYRAVDWVLDGRLQVCSFRNFEFENRDLSSVLATFWAFSDSQDSKTQKDFVESNFSEKIKLINRDIWSLEEEWSTKYWIKWNWLSWDNSFDGTFWQLSGARIVTEEKKILFYNVSPPQV